MGKKTGIEKALHDRFKVVFWKDGKKDWRFTVMGGNGEIVAQSEGYSRKKDAFDIVDRLWPDADPVGSLDLPDPVVVSEAPSEPVSDVLVDAEVWTDVPDDAPGYSIDERAEAH